MKKNNFQLKIWIIVVVFLLLAAFGIARADFNEQINFQGKLTDTNDLAVSDDDYNMEFKLWSDETSTSGEYLIWTETATGTNRISATSGLFSYLLGSVSSLSGVDFNQILWLGVNIGGTGDTPDWDGEMTPRKKLGAVSAAFEAKKLGGKLESAFATLAEDETVTGVWTFNNILSISVSTSTTPLTVTQSGNGNIVDIKNATGSVFTIANNGTVTVVGNIMPSTTTTYSLGSDTYKWRYIYSATSVMDAFQMDTNATSGYVLTSDSSGVGTWSSLPDLGVATGTGVTNYLTKWTSTSTLSTSTIYDNGTFVGIGTTTAYGGEKLTVYGNIYGSGNIIIGGTATTTNLAVTGTTTLGSATSTPTIFTGYINSDIIPYSDSYYNLGSSDFRWANIYAATATIGSTITISSNTLEGSGTTTLFTTGNANQLVLGANGNVGIGTTTPAYTLEVVSSGTTTVSIGSTSTDYLTIGDGWGKLYAASIDPLFNIKGSKYSTYGLSMTGIKEETVDIISLTMNDNDEYSYTIDFNEVEEASDLWIFYQVTDFGENWQDLAVLLSGEGRGQVWYEKNPAQNQLSIYGESPTHVSYRLTSPRFDWHRYLNVSENGMVTGIVVGETINDQYTQATSTDIQTVEDDSQDEGLLGTFVSKVKEALSSLGMLVENGIAQVRELIVENIIFKKAEGEKIKVQEFEIVDKATGEIYCTWIENGQWQKIRGECDSSTFTLPSGGSTASPPSEESAESPSGIQADEPQTEEMTIEGILLEEPSDEEPVTKESASEEEPETQLESSDEDPQEKQVPNGAGLTEQEEPTSEPEPMIE